MGVLLFYFLVYFELFRRRIRVKPLGTPASVYVRALPFSVHRMRAKWELYFSNGTVTCENSAVTSNLRAVELYGNIF